MDITITTALLACKVLSYSSTWRLFFWFWPSSVQRIVCSKNGRCVFRNMQILQVHRTSGIFYCSDYSCLHTVRPGMNFCVIVWAVVFLRELNGADWANLSINCMIGIDANTGGIDPPLLFQWMKTYLPHFLTMFKVFLYWIHSLPFIALWIGLSLSPLLICFQLDFTSMSLFRF
jgi:hypothetical protein